MDDKGQDLPLTLKGKGTLNTPLVELTEQQQSFTFTDLPARPRLSINRGFSAPILLESGASSSELLFLMGHDGDSFNRWDAARKLASDLFLGQASGQSPNEKPFAEALAKSLHNTALDQAFKGLLLRFPSEQEMAARIGKDVDADQLRLSRDDVLHRVAMHLNNPLLQALEATREYGPYRPDPQGTARRSLRYAALGLLARADERLALAVAQQDFESAHSMTAEVGALSAVLQITHPLVDTLLEEFYARHKDDPLLVDKWFMLQGARPLDGAAHHASALMQHPDFKLTTPNRVYALLGGFTGNQAGFHAVDGAGYKLLADSVMVLDSINPQVASRMATSFRSWRLFNAPRQQHAEVQMGRILAVQGLSRDVYEIISRTLVG